MAAPSVTAVNTPSGIRVEDGFSTTITFARLPTVSFWEKQVKPPGVDGGDKIDTTTMRNSKVRTASNRHLYTLMDPTATVMYDPSVHANMISALINAPGSVTVRFPDGTSCSFYGYLQKFEPSDNKEGEAPEATITVAVTNWDPSNHVEAEPVYTSVTGT